VRLDLAQHVEGPLADLARDGERGRVRTVVPAAAEIELVIGAALAAGVLGGLDQSPTQARRPLLGELPAPLLVGGIPDSRVQPSGADDLASAAEPRGVADLGEDRARQDRPDPEDALQRLEAVIGLGQPAQLAVQQVDLWTSPGSVDTGCLGGLGLFCLDSLPICRCEPRSGESRPAVAERAVLELRG
jgi:hypothetical protein